MVLNTRRDLVVVARTDATSEDDAGGADHLQVLDDVAGDLGVDVTVVDVHQQMRAREREAQPLTRSRPCPATL